MLHWVVGGDLVGRLYPDEVSNLDERVARLSDSKCQTRSAGDTPLHLAAKFGGVGMVKDGVGTGRFITLSHNSMCGTTFKRVTWMS